MLLSDTEVRVYKLLSANDCYKSENLEKSAKFNRLGQGGCEVAQQTRWYGEKKQNIWSCPKQQEQRKMETYDRQRYPALYVINEWHLNRFHVAEIE